MYSVLYVDDDPALLDIGKIYLDMSGNFSVDTSGSVSEAIEMIRKKRYDAIVSDYEMAETNGIEFLRYVRQQFKDLPFILFTGRGREDIVIEAINNGADFYLQKGGEPKAQFAELDYKIRTAIDRRRVQGELQESRKQLSDLINFLPDATFAIDLKGRVIVWNRMMEELTGVPPDAVMGTGNLARKLPLYEEERPPLADYIVHAEGDPQEKYPNLKRNGDKLLAEMYHPPHRQNGKGSYFWHTASPLYDVTGHIIGAIESVRDVTQRKETEEKLKRTHEELSAAYEQLTATEEEIRQNYDELEKSEELIRQSEERYHNVIEDQTEFICRFTPDGKLSFVNNAYCRYFGLDPDSCIGKPHNVTIPREDAVQMQQQMATLTPTNPVTTISNRILMPDGSVRWQQWSDRAIFDPAGRIIEIQSVGRDITSEKAQEEKLKLTYEELNAAYEQLTGTEEELRQNYEELNKSQTELHGAYEQLTAIEEELRSNFEELALTEQSLRQSEERYRNVVEDQTEFVCRFTPDGKLTFVNEAYCRYFGLDRTTCIGQRHTVTIPPADLARMNVQLSQITRENPAAIIEHQILMPSGEIRWQRWSDRAIFDKDGHIIEYQSVGRDTTDRVIAEEKLQFTNEQLHSAYEELTATEEELRQNYDELNKSQTELHGAYEQLTAIEEELRSNFEELALTEQSLRQSEERYRNVIEDQTEFICRFTPDGKLSFVNNAYCRYFGLDPESCIGKSHQVSIPKEDLALMQEKLAELTPEQPIATIDHRIIMPSGEVRWQHWSDRAIFDSAGKIIEYQSVGRDITERRRMEQALEESNKKLNLLSSITRHDILNQLTALQGSLGLLELEIANPDQLRLLAKAIQSSDVIQSQILFTQQYQDIGVKKPRWQNLHAAVTTVCMDNGYSNVVIDPALNEWEVYADPLLRMVFLNLFDNASMHGGNVTGIRVGGERTADGFVIAVEDDGEGVPMEEKKRIFQKGVGKHTGLGLFLVQEVLAITGLSISETGEYHKGARFEIHVPAGTFRNVHHELNP